MKKLLPILLLFATACGSQTSGPSNGFIAYTGQAIVQVPTLPNMGTQTNSGLVWLDPSYPSGTPSKVVRCTDQTLMASTDQNQSKSAGLGGSGSAQWLFNANSTLVHFNDQGGHGYITLFNPISMVCGDPISGHAITADKDLTNPGSATSVFNFSSGSFDAANPNIWYVSGGAGGATDFTGASVGSYIINTNNGTFTVGAKILDYQYGLPFSATNAPAWTASTAYTNGQYVSYTLNSTQAPDWQANFSGYNLGDIILPLTKNPLGCAFKFTQTGTTSGSGSEPTWSTSGACTTASNGQLSDGSAKWRNLGGPPTFAYQVTGGNCTSGSTFPLSGHPDLIAALTDNTCTLTNSGLAFGTQGSAFSGVSRNGKRFCGEFSNNYYGYSNTSGSGYYLNANGGQGTAFLMVCYDAAINEYFLLNLGTGIQSVVSCSLGNSTDYKCTGGAFSMTAEGTLSTLDTCPIFIHNSRSSTGMDYVEVQRQASMAGATGCPGGDGYDWLPFQTFNASSSLQVYPGTLNHWATGFQNLIDIGQSAGTNCLLTAGAYSCILSSSNTAATTLINWVVNPCASSWVGNGTDANPPCGFGAAYDSHLSWAYNPFDQDNTPVCGTMFNQSSNIGTVGYPLIVAPWQQEEICISTTPTTTVTTSALGTVWRFNHTFMSMTNGFFDAQFGISQLSTDGHFIAFTSDWYCSLGDTGGNATSLCGLPWQTGFAYALNTLISPIGALNGTGSKYDVFKITTAGTSGASFPGFSTPLLAWASCTGSPGCTVTDSNGVVYTDQGVSNGKSEVFITQTDSFLAAFAPSGMRLLF
jgi:hypothetical protein